MIHIVIDTDYDQILLTQSQHIFLCKLTTGNSLKIISGMILLVNIYQT